MALEMLKYLQHFPRFTNLRPGISQHELTYRARIGSERNDPRIFDLSIPLSAFPGLAEDEQAHEQREGQREKQSALAGLAAVGGTLFAGLSGAGAGSASAGGTAASSIPSIPVDATLFGEIPGAGASVAGSGAAGAAGAAGLSSFPADATLFGETPGVGASVGSGIPEIPVDSTLFGETPGLGSNLAPAGGVGASSIPWGSLARGIPGLLGAFAADKQADAFSDQAARFMSMGAPYRDRLAALYANPNAFLRSPEVTIPVQQGTDALARSLSVHGNPVGNMTALQELQNYSANQLFGRLGQEKDRLAGFGGLSAYNAAAPGASTNAINAQTNVYGGLGAAAADVINPPTTLAELLREINKGVKA